MHRLASVLALLLLGLVSACEDDTAQLTDPMDPPDPSGTDVGADIAFESSSDSVSWEDGEIEFQDSEGNHWKGVRTTDASGNVDWVSFSRNDTVKFEQTFEGVDGEDFEKTKFHVPEDTTDWSEFDDDGELVTTSAPEEDGDECEDDEEGGGGGGGGDDGGGDEDDPCGEEQESVITVSGDEEGDCDDEKDEMKDDGSRVIVSVGLIYYLVSKEREIPVSEIREAAEGSLSTVRSTYRYLRCRLGSGDDEDGGDDGDDGF